MKNLLLILVFTGILTSCGPALETIPQVINETAEEQINDTLNEYSYLALGDSYTIGEGVSYSERWPVQLVEELNERGYAVAPPKIVAETGWTTQNLLIAMDNQLYEPRLYDLVSILIGVNNQYQDKTLEDYELDLNEIFRFAITKSRNGVDGVFALSIPDYGATPFGGLNSEEISEEIDEFNAVYRRVADEFGVDFYNITPISREVENDPDLLAEDDLHPSGLMYRSWMLYIIEEVEKKLPEQ